MKEQIYRYVDAADYISQRALFARKSKGKLKQPAASAAPAWRL
jgi:hypothetical protein